MESGLSTTSTAEERFAVESTAIILPGLVSGNAGCEGDDEEESVIDGRQSCSFELDVCVCVEMNLAESFAFSECFVFVGGGLTERSDEDLVVVLALLQREVRHAAVAVAVGGGAVVIFSFLDLLFERRNGNNLLNKDLPEIKVVFSVIIMFSDSDRQSKQEKKEQFCRKQMNRK